MKKGTLQHVLDGSAVIAHRRAFKSKLPFAVSKDGQVLLVYADNSTEAVTDERLNKLTKTNS